MTSTDRVLAFDLGATKIAVGIVRKDGKVLEQLRVSTETRQGKAGLIRQLQDLGDGFLSRDSSIRSIGIASAGPLDPQRGVLLDPTNMIHRGTHGPGPGWGKVLLTRPLEQRWSRTKNRRTVTLENDAAASVLAEKWLGAGKQIDNLMTLTLGTGLGTGMVCNGELVRSGRGLHPEAGHVIIHYGDFSATCACGNHGCAEAYLAATHFARRFNHRHSTDFSAAEIAALAKKRDLRAISAFSEYSIHLAIALHNYVVLYAPELVALTGSFAQAAPFFLKATRKQLERFLVRRRVGVDLMPQLVLSALGNDAGLLGGARVAFVRMRHNQ